MALTRETSTAKQLKEILREYEEETRSHFVLKYSDKLFFEDDLNKLSEVIAGQRIQWSLSALTDRGLVLPFTGVPFVFLGNRTLACHHGPDLNKSTKMKQRDSRAAKSKDSQAVLKQRYLIQPTKKMDCPVVLHMKKIIAFPDFKIDFDSEYSRRCTAKILKEMLLKPEVLTGSETQSKTPRMELKYYALLPDPSTHENHVLQETDGIRESLRVRTKKRKATEPLLPEQNLMVDGVTAELSELAGRHDQQPGQLLCVDVNGLQTVNSIDQSSLSLEHQLNTADVILVNKFGHVGNCIVNCIEQNTVSVVSGDCQQVCVPVVSTFDASGLQVIGLRTQSGSCSSDVVSENRVEKFVPSFDGVVQDSTACQPMEYHAGYCQNYPDLLVLMVRAKLAARYSKLDEEQVASLVTKLQHEGHNVAFVPTVVKTEADIQLDYSHISCMDDDEDAECHLDVPHATFAFVYQSPKMQRLYQRYGSQLLVVDPIYHPGRYPLPIFFVMVRTNVNYQVAAVFVVQQSTVHSVAAALQTLHGWNPNVNPRFAMVDVSDVVISALEMTFPDIQVYLSDYHRERNWLRWIAAARNEQVIDHDVKMKLRRIANAPCVDDLNRAVSEFESSAHFVNNKRLAYWFHHKWKQQQMRWCLAYRDAAFLLATMTNNGTKHMNEDFKHDFLDNCKDSCLSELLSYTIYSFLPMQYQTYVELNVRSSSLFRKYNTDVPHFLRNRPRRLIDDMRKKMISLDTSAIVGVQMKSEGVFVVPSSSGRPPHEVVFGNETTCCSCSCVSFQRTRLLCRHFCMVFQAAPEWSFERISPLYTQNPLLILDSDVLEQNGSGNLLETTLPDVCADNSNKSTTAASGNSEMVVVRPTLKSEQRCVQKLLKNFGEMVCSVTDVDALYKLRVGLESLGQEILPHVSTAVKTEVPIKGSRSALAASRRRHIGQPLRRRRRRKAAIQNCNNVKVVEIQLLDGSHFDEIQAATTTCTFTVEPVTGSPLLVS